MELVSFFNYRKTSRVYKAKRGNKEEFLALIDENRLNIYRVARGILNNEQDLEDAIQNTVMKAFKNIKSLKNDEYFKTWIIRILINECNEILRKNKKLILLEDESKEEQHKDKYENLDLTKAINSLSEEFRIVTVLFYFEDMSIKEIAKLLDIAEGTVRSRLTRARLKLREVMGEV